MAWLWSALMPHPPVLVPEIGNGRENEAAKTLDGVNQLITEIKHSKPDVLILLSPHQPYMPGGLFVNSAVIYNGTFAMFGVPEVKINAASYTNEMNNFCGCLTQNGIRFMTASHGNLTEDQGSLVPLYFMKKAWGNLPFLIIASPIGLSPKEAYDLGKALAKYQSVNRLALLASGDLSHRLTPDAPAGYEPEYAMVFESAVEEAIKNFSPDPILQLDSKIITRAGECGLRSLMTMLGLVNGLAETDHSRNDIKIYSHEWPFGVGYCNALSVFNNEQPAPVRLARETVTRYLKDSQVPDNGSEITQSQLWLEHKACFVSIKKKNGELRGCIGTLSPLYDTLDKEIIANAVSSATRDPRFLPMTFDELDNVFFSVDVLSEPEVISGPEELDVKKFGVIVSKGFKRGVLLPDLEGVDSVQDQIRIAAMKAGIYDTEGMKLERFTVTRYQES